MIAIASTSISRQAFVAFVIDDVDCDPGGLIYLANFSRKTQAIFQSKVLLPANKGLVLILINFYIILIYLTLKAY
jgi:hypothetical protein